MKILFLSDNFLPKTIGGAGIVAYNLARKLNDYGHEIFVITTVEKRTEEGRIKLGNLNIFQIYVDFHERWQNWVGLYNHRAVSSVGKILNEIKPDIVHAHNIHQRLSYHCLKLAKKNAKKVFLTAHDVNLFLSGKLMPKNGKCIYRATVMNQIKESQKQYNPFRNVIIRRYLKYVDRIFVVSNSLKELLKVNGIKNTETIYNGIDLADWQINKEEVENFKKKHNLFNKKIIIFAARLIEAKGGDKLIESLALVSRRFPDFILMVVGKQWAYTEKMKQMAEKFNIKNKIVFIGSLNEAELKTAYHSSDISVFPSLCFETFGMANLTAMACKKPTISSCFGGPSEVIIDGETGYLLNPNDIEFMAEKTLDLLENSEKAKNFGEAGYERAKNYFSLNKQVQATMDWYCK